MPRGIKKNNPGRKGKEIITFVFGLLQLDKRGGVPFPIINGRSIRGFSASAYERALQE